MVRDDHETRSLWSRSKLFPARLIAKFLRDFVGRMAASMLHAIGLPELATESSSGYEALASTIASDAAYCSSLKARIARNRETFPLFDTARVSRHIEAAYEAMWQAYREGRPPERLEVKMEG